MVDRSSSFFRSLEEGIGGLFNFQALFFKMLIKHASIVTLLLRRLLETELILCSQKVGLEVVPCLLIGRHLLPSLAIPIHR